jgi:diguanylate cyclase (GGDEF)-like protein
MPGNSALETMRVRTDGALVRVLVTASPIRDKEVEAVAASAIALDDTGLRQAQDELRGAKEALETANQQLQQSLAREETLARTDGLTGLCNRVYFEELAIREFHAAVRYQRALAIMMIDIDNFKRVNDTLGHAAGDEALRLLARTAAAHTRAADVIARLGGDEFILLLPETTAQQALPIADRIVTSVAATPIGDAEDALAVTLSVGIAELRRKPMDDQVEQVVQRADRALYQAKADGRNRTRVFDLGTQEPSAAGNGRAEDRHGRTAAQADRRARGTARAARRKRTVRGKG